MFKLKKREKKPKTFAYVQDWGSYPNETLVVVGMNNEEIVKFLKKIKAKQWFIDWIEKENIGANAEAREDKGYFAHHKACSILWLKEYTGKWEDFEVLIHETNHAVFLILGESKCMGAEIEALAYQQEYLFRNIRRKLQDYYKF